MRNQNSNFFGPAPVGESGLFGLPTAKVPQMIRSNPTPGLGSAATAAGVTSGIVIGALVVNYALGRYVAAPIIESVTGKKMHTSVKQGIGVAVMFL